MLNHGTQHEMRQQNSPTTKQMHYKFKLEKTKNNVYSKTYSLNVFWTILSTINSSNLLSISPHTPITKNNGGCSKRLEHAVGKTMNGVFRHKMQFHKRIKC